MADGAEFEQVWGVEGGELFAFGRAGFAEVEAPNELVG